MFEKVNPSHPDKVADRIAGALVDLAYSRESNPKVAVEVLIGHGYAYIIAESSVEFRYEDVVPIVTRIVGRALRIRLLCIPQDVHLAANQAGAVRCGDNGIFKGTPITNEQRLLTALADTLYRAFPTDGKYVVCNYLPVTPPAVYPSLRGKVTICQSNAKECDIKACVETFTKEALKKLQAVPEFDVVVNPLGEWTGGPDVDCGATNRKLGSDMGDGMTGGGLMGKDLSKADVSVNIVCFLKAVETGQTVTASCSIGDERVTLLFEDGHSETLSYADIVEQARLYIHKLGGFEAFACWGLISPYE